MCNFFFFAFLFFAILLFLNILGNVSTSNKTVVPVPQDAGTKESATEQIKIKNKTKQRFFFLSKSQDPS